MVYVKRKANKWTEDWNNGTCLLTGKKTNIKVKERKPDGSEEEVDKEIDNDVKYFFEERTKIVQEIKLIEGKVKEKSQYADEAARASMVYDDLKERVNYYKQGTNLTDLTNAWKRFHGTDGGITNKYRGNGILANLQNWYPATYDSSNSKEYNNLYHGYVNLGSTNEEVKFTENEAYQLIFRVMKVIEKVDESIINSIYETTLKRRAMMIGRRRKIKH